MPNIRLPVPLLLVITGLPGLLVLPFVLPDLPGVPRAALLINPAILLAIAAVAGTPAAKRSGLRLRSPDATVAGRLFELGAGALLGVAIAAADHLGREWWQVTPGRPGSVLESWTPALLLAGILYGGMVEEVLMRWGVMSLATLALWRTIARRSSSPPTAVLALAALTAAIAFGMAHLPALGLQDAELSFGPVLRTLFLNVIAGLFYGWCFARRDLLAAMGAHAGTHLGFAVLALLA
jgi:hypothetical protein